MFLVPRRRLAHGSSWQVPKSCSRGRGQLNVKQALKGADRSEARDVGQQHQQWRVVEERDKRQE